MIALLLCLSLAQDSATVVGPLYRNALLGIELPRPFDDWVFDAATERGTTTVIFHPRGSPLSDHLWGVLVLSPWDGPPPLDGLADRRIADTWRRTYGTSFELLSRDSVDVNGLQAIRLRMSGNIQRAVVDVEELLIARGTDLIVLQFRYPRGVPRDSIARGYARSMDGLRLRSADPPPVADASQPFAPSIENGQVVFEVPQDMRVVTAGALTTDAMADGRRTMRFRPIIEGAAPLYAVGRFEQDQRPAGRLSFRIWRNTDPTVTATRASDSALAMLARGWARYWRAFGPVPLAELIVVETSWPATAGGGGIVFLGADVSEAVLMRELARTWWGGFVRSRGPLAALIDEALPAWAPILNGVPTTDSLGLAVERARRAAGDAVFREAIRTLASDARSSDDAIEVFFGRLGAASAPLRPSLR